MSFNPEYFFPTLITNITGLNGGLFGDVKSTDVYAAVDVTDLTQSPTGTTKPYQILQLVNFILQRFGFSVYLPVLAATTGSNLNATYDNGASGVGATLTNAGVNAAFVIDGITGVLDGRYLIKDETILAQTGIYTLNPIGDATTPWKLTRAVDFNQPANIIDGGIVYVIGGNTLDNSYWQDTFVPAIVVGTTDIHWNEFNIQPNQLVWTDVTAVSVNAAVNNGYIADRSSTPVQVLLPANFNIGDTVIVLGKGTGGWSLIANAGQIIQFGSQSTNILGSGSIDSDIQYGNIQVRGLVQDTIWEVTTVFGNPSITQGSVQMATNNQTNEQGPLLDGQLYIGSTSGHPVAANLTPGTGVGIVNAANSITISASGGGLTWSTVTAATLAAAINNAYVLNHAATPCVVTLPATAALGSLVAVQSLAASGGFTLTANTGQTIQFGNTSTSSAGSLSSTDAGDSCWVVCIVANLTWAVVLTQSAGLTIV